MHNYLLAHDLGTSGDKAVLFNADTLEIVTSVVQPYETHYVENGGVEHECEDWWKAVCASTRFLLENAGVDAADIKAVSFSAIMNSCLPVDANGNALRRAMIWCDQRSGASVDEIRKFVSDDEFYRITGHKLNNTYCVAKMHWFKNNQPELFAQTAYFIQAKDYLVFKLTGKIATDYSDTSHLGIMDQTKLDYWTEMLDFLGIPLSMLPPLHKSTDVIGHVTAEAARECGLVPGTAVVMGGGDGCCANAGAGAFKPGLAYNILGTSSWHGTVSDKMLASPDKICASFVHLDGECYSSIGTMQSAGHSLDWLLGFLYGEEYEQNKDKIFADLNTNIAEKLSSGKMQNLLYLPYLLGERSPWWNSNARGCFIGMDASTGKTDAILACLEGVAFNLKIILDDMEKNLGTLDMRIIGGGARNKQWIKILASVWNKRLAIPKYGTEATSLGAILCAGIGAGIFKDFSAIEKINPVVDYVDPEPKLQPRYERLYPIFKDAYLSMVDTFDKLRAN